MSASQTAATSESPERCCEKTTPLAMKNSNIQLTWLPTLSMQKRIYWGDRFIPSRRGYSFEAAHYLLTSKSNGSDNARKNKKDINITKEVDLLDTTHRRETLRAAMGSLEIVSDLKQRRILRTFKSDCSFAQASDSEGSYSPWRCTARKKPLIGSYEKMYIPISDFNDVEDDASHHLIDWSNRDALAVSHQKTLMVFNENGTMLTAWFNKDIPCAIKWSNDGNKLACTLQNLMMLEIYDFVKKKFLWRVACCCLNQGNDVNVCTNRCICWSRDDRLVLTGCIGRVSIFDINTGQMLYNTTSDEKGRVLSLSFSPNFRFLMASIAYRRDKIVQIFTWPDLTPWSGIRFQKTIKAAAWHPETSGLLCIGSNDCCSLLLWNVNTAKMLDYVNIEPVGSVENFAWNKLSGELLIHWSYTVNTKRYSVFPVFANFKRIVDAIPYNRETNPSFLKFNSTHEQLIGYHNGVITTWNFFGNEKPARRLPVYDSAKQNGETMFSNIR